MKKYVYQNRTYIDDELVDEAIQIQADVNNRDLSSEELEVIWRDEVTVIEDDLEDRVKTVIKKVRPYMWRHGGDLEFLELKERVAYIKFKGACIACSLKDNTIGAVSQVLMEAVAGLLGVEEVEEENYNETK